MQSRFERAENDRARLIGASGRPNLTRLLFQSRKREPKTQKPALAGVVQW